MTERVKTMNKQVEAVNKAIAILREAFPGAPVSLSIYSTWAQVLWHGTSTYAEAVEWYRSLGCKTREKHPFDTYTQLDGEAHGIKWSTFPNELPPTCRKVKKVERVPKTKTVETGEFIEIEREVVECGPDPDEIAAQASQPQPEPATV